MRIWLGVFLFCVGIGLIMYPMYFHYKQGNEIAQLEQALQQIESNEDDGDNSDTELLQDTIRLIIPSIELNQPILPTTTEDNLNVALTQIKSNQEVGSGNFTIAGHLSTKEGRHFNQLPNVQVGAVVQLLKDEKLFTYKVDSKHIVEATDVAILNDKEEISEITLITCTPDGTQRLAVKGHLVQ